VASRNGMLVAQGRLAIALSQQLGGAAPSDGEVRVGLSFLSNEGSYCRSFTLVGMAQDLVGIACRARGVAHTGAGAKCAAAACNGQLPHGGDGDADGAAGSDRPAHRRRHARPEAELEALRRNWQR
jgi:hypothetical protein